MGEGPIKVGDRVINLQVPGIFVVLGRQGTMMVEIRSDAGLRMVVHEASLRRLHDAPDPDKGK